jgi:hypothetical protein
MQPQQVKNEFPRIEQVIDNAAQKCQLTSGLPDELRQSLAELDQESDRAKAMLMEEQNGNRIVQCIDRLEKLGDRAMQACNGAGVDPELQRAVKEAHDALSDLKHRLH